jgi:DNA-binding transcriptional LysR family regulator
VLDVRRLQALRELAARGTVVAAADALHLTPPAVSQQLAALEREAGVKLLRREGRNVRLTEAGHQLVAHAEVIHAQLEAAEADLAAGEGQFGSELSIAAFPTAIGRFGGDLLAALRELDPRLIVRVCELEPEDSLGRLRTGDVDLAIAHEYDRVPRRATPGTERIELLTEPMLLALADDHPRAREGVALADLADDPHWVLPPAPGVTCRDAVLRMCAQAGFSPSIASEAYSYEATMVLVSAGGVALVPALACATAPPGVQVFAPSDVDGRRIIFAAVRRGSIRRPSVAAAIAALRDVADREDRSQDRSLVSGRR